SASVVSANTIEFSAVQEIVAAITTSHPEAHFAFETLTGGLVDRNFISRNPRHAHVMDDLSELVTRDVVKILVSIGSDDSEALHGLLDPLVATSCHASFSDPVNGLVELAPMGVTKAKTLESLCEHLGVARDQVMAFGDMPNDIEMLTWAGHGVAMGNALDSVKGIAAAVTETVDDDGVARYLNAVLDSHRR
ncbi:MAG: HAD family hydrolase, partial [Brevibacterium sp.]|nr:HAD family hydrolase [Brevibacterium sp.]